MPIRSFLCGCALLVAAAWPIVGAAASAQAPKFEIDRKRLDPIFVELDRPGLPGGVVLVRKDGRRVYEKAFGLASVEHGVRNTPATVFKIAYGESREFTAMAVAMLVRKGVLSLDDTLRKYMPELPAYADAITLRHLVHHASGLPDYGALFLLTGWQLFNPLSDEEFMRLLGRMKQTDFAPGTDYMYSNTDYALLAFVVKRATGKSLREIGNSELFAPLGMTGTQINDNHGLVVAARAHNYFVWPDGLFLARREKTSPAGRNGVLTTVGDLAKWAAALDDSGSAIAKAAALLRERAQFAPGRPGEHVFGHYHSNYRGLEIVTHQGIQDEIYLVRVPAHDMSIAMLGNGQVDPQARLYRALDALFFESPGPPQGEPGAPAEKLAKWEALSAAHPGGVAIPAEDRARLPGTYAKADGTRGDKFDLIIENDKLVGVYGDARDPVIPLAPGVFRYFSFYLEQEPARPGAPVRFMAYRTRTGEFVEHFGKVPPPPRADPKSLASLPGRYYNHELDVTWTLAVEDRKLLLRRERMMDTVLHPTGPDEYELPVLADVEAYIFDMNLKIERDAAGNAERFTIKHSRIRGLHFDRQGRAGR